jgi:UDP-N-acetylmuramoylalanine--D-glutamate ligase
MDLRDMTLPVSWHGDWSKLSAVVLGLGKSGFSVVDTLVELGVQTTALAKSVAPEILDLVEVIGARVLLGDEPALLDQLERTPDFAVVSPGFAPSHPLLVRLSAMGVQLVSDIDLAWRLRDKTASVAKWLSVTGTNGKTTTTELVAHMLRTANYRAVACGNIGTPVLDMIRDPEGFDFLVLELSSFQLHYTGEINPVVSAFLNFADDHLDWHGSRESYLQAKSKVYAGTELALVFNEQDSSTFEAAKAASVLDGARGVSFSLGIPGRSMIGYVEEFLVDRAFLEERADSALEIAELEDLECIGPVSDQLRQNVAAATAMVRALDIPPALIKAAIRSFELAPHRVQLVAEVAGVRFIDDSKATNAHAAAASLGSFESVVWIVGGLLKGVDISPLLEKHGKRLRAAVVIGADTSELERIFAEKLPQLAIRILTAAPMSEVVDVAIELAQSGDTVLLAPAAASMDQYRDYVHRGLSFQAEVKRRFEL